MTDAFGARRVQVKPPEKGVFPLDHDGECKETMKVFLSCLKEHNQDHFPCKAFSKAYLECRMDNSLMARESMDTLGLGEQGSYERVADKIEDRESKGFIAGLNVKGSKKGWFW